MKGPMDEGTTAALGRWTMKEQKDEERTDGRPLRSDEGRNYIDKQD